MESALNGSFGGTYGSLSESSSDSEGAFGTKVFCTMSFGRMENWSCKPFSSEYL